MNKYKIKYNIVKTYSNGVRVGNIPEHKMVTKRSGLVHAWFPKDWDEEIVEAGTFIGNLKKYDDVADGIVIYENYKGVRVGIIRTDGEISAIFPDIDQSSVIQK